MEPNASDSKVRDRRAKYRFNLERELRYKITEESGPAIFGTGQTINLCSGGVLFASDQPLKLGAFIELSISWPVLLDDNCPMRLIAFGRILRAEDRIAVCSIEKYEFRTSSRGFRPTTPGRDDGMLQRWADGMRKGILRESVASA
jgi:hypothetical protein